MMPATSLCARLERGERLEIKELMVLGDTVPLAELMALAERLTIEGFDRTVSYSRKVFIPLTRLCRNVCHYCTFATAPRNLESPFLAPDEVAAIARVGVDAGCAEALFTLGDKPELRYNAAREALSHLGHATTLQYLEAVARLVHAQSGLLPHLNPGIMEREALARLRSASVSMGIMLETSAARLCAPGGPHYGSPDKAPARRLETLRLAGELAIPFTSGILIGIGETRVERTQSLIELRELHERYGHLQEIIVQNFRAKPGTKMAGAAEPSLEEQLWTIAMARLIFGPTMSIQTPPNLRPGALEALIAAGVNDWGGVSPVTPDHVNPEAPWPHLTALAAQTTSARRTLVERLAIAPRYARDAVRWVDAALVPAVVRHIDAEGYRREDSWHAGADRALPSREASIARASPPLDALIERAAAGGELAAQDIVRLFSARGPDFDALVSASDALRRKTVGDAVTYVVNRNINYTNVCLYHCGFCAFSKGRSAKSLRGPAYRLDLEEIALRAVEAAQAGATEVCLQGGIHPSFTGDTYLDIVSAVKSAVPDIHVHAFSPLEIRHGAATLGLPLGDFLERLQAAGLSTLPGTAAEILDDEIRAKICPDKLSTVEWLEVIATAHRVGLKTTATIMFGHVEQSVHWARHLLRIRRLQEKTGGFTEFVPLPFVHMEAPLWRKGRSRSGPTLREAVLMHAVARLVFHPVIRNIQTSWVKMGAEGAALCLRSGANDLGGTLMDESITRAAGGIHGQQVDAARIAAIAARLGRPARQRSTLYANVNPSSTTHEGSPQYAIPVLPETVDEHSDERIESCCDSDTKPRRSNSDLRIY